LDDPHNLCRRYEPPLSICFTCKGKQHLEDKRYYYYCDTCDLEFHRGCHLFLCEIKHPFHLIHPLTLTSILPESDPDSEIHDLPIKWGDSSSVSDDGVYVPSLDYDGSEFDHMVKCNFCRKHLQREEDDDMICYHCSTCNFSIHVTCAMIRPPLTIENLKTHDHTLTLFPRQIPLPCDACGFSLEVPLDHVYSCLLCNYLVHRTCIYLPRVIKITRHPHRLSFTSSIVPSRQLSCGLCRKTVDVNYGSYTCNKGCHYALHSRCATNKRVWDGKDLEGVPEEKEEILEPFSWIDEETIQHFSHDHHHLKLRQNGGSSHENKFCKACTLPMTVSDRFYSCTECEFVLHETCASLPRKLYHPVHKHPLTLFHPFSSNPHELEREYYKYGFFKCYGCCRSCCGFMYKCSEESCGFQLDARCASLPDPLIHDCHPRDHPLFFNFTKGTCMGFESVVCNQSEYLECIQCKSFLSLNCATLPCVAHYKHDKHPLTLCYGEEETSDLLKYWCEICEEKLDATEWFYTCDSCCVTLHVTCLLGKEVYYLKPNHIINMYDEYNAEIRSNNGNTRPSVLFKRQEKLGEKVTCKQAGGTIVMDANATSTLHKMGVSATNDSFKYIWFQGHESEVKGIYTGSAFLESYASGDNVGLVLASTSFYPEQGGQIFDTGIIEGSFGTFNVCNVKIFGGFVLHIGSLSTETGEVSVGDKVTCKVDYERRKLIAPNHTCTHMLNFALKEVLGDHIDQKGSIVLPEKLRFDFSHAKRIKGLRAVFGEVYPDPVRVVAIGRRVEDLLADPENDEWSSLSSEFCGGTHITNTREAKAFALLSEEGIQKGIRRIIAVTTDCAFDALNTASLLEKEVDDASKAVGSALEKGTDASQVSTALDLAASFASMKLN
ncbi:Cysteine/Histidine-rich C1 domain family protein, partial [Hirschfeldia incana]